MFHNSVHVDYKTRPRLARVLDQTRHIFLFEGEQAGAATVAHY